MPLLLCVLNLLFQFECACIQLVILAFLGNQLFMYAAGRSVAKRTGAEFKLDTTWYDDVRRHRFAHEGHARREFSLDLFNISAAIATNDEIRQFTLPQNMPRLLYGILRKFCRPHHVYEEGKGDFRLEDITEPAYLKGYWTSPEILENVRDELRTEIVFRDGVLDERELANEVSLMDTLGNGPNGTADGVVSQKGYERLWCNPNRTPEQAGALLRHNYSKMNMANLGMPWDNCCEQRSRAIGSRYQNEYGQPYYKYGQMGIPYSTNIPVYNNCCGTNGYVNPGYNYPQYVNPLYQGQPVVYNKLQNIMGQLVQIAQMLMSRGYSY